MGTFTIEVEDVKYNEFVNFCKLNSIVPEEFISKAFIEKYTVLKYGDLNEKVAAAINKKKESEKKPKKENKKQEITVEKEVKNVKTEEVVQDYVVTEGSSDNNEPKKKTRIIKSR